jgi:hypothetical protein
VHPQLQDIQALLAASRDLVGAEELDAVRLQTWSAERNIIFTRLKKIHDLALGTTDSSALEGLIQELLEVDGKICTRLIESQKRLGENLATARKFRRVLSTAAAKSPQLLQRLA